MANSVGRIVALMRDDNVLNLKDVNNAYGWKFRPYNYMGISPRWSGAPSWWQTAFPSFYNSGEWQFILPWMVVFEAVGNTATNTRIQIRNCELYVKKTSTGAWVRLSTGNPSGYNYTQSGNLQGGVPNVDVRQEISGGPSFKPVPDYNFHGWFGGRIAHQSDIACWYVAMEARLIRDSNSLPDDTANALFGLQVGADYYPIDSALPSGTYVPAVGISQTAQITSEWQSFTMATLSDVGVQEPGGGLTVAQFSANPPPLNGSVAPPTTSASLVWDNDTALTIDAAVKAASTTAAKTTAYYAAASGSIPNPQMIVDTATDSLIIPLSQGWTRVDNSMRIPAQSSSGTAAATYASAGITGYRLQSGDRAAFIKPEALTFTGTISPGAYTISIGQINIGIPQIIGDAGQSGGGGGIPVGYYAGDNIAPYPSISSLPTAPTPVLDGSGDSGYTYNEITKGTAVSVNNPWNFGGWGLTNGGNATMKCIIGESLSQTNSWRVQFNVPEANKVGGGVSEVVAYPAIAFGMNVGFANNNHPNIPIQYKNINVCYVGQKAITVTSESGFKGHLSHDMRAMDTNAYIAGYSSAEPHIRTELFIVARTWGGYGAHPAGRDPARFRGTVTIAANSWHIYIQPGASTYLGVANPQIIWLPATLPMPDILDIAPLFKWAMRTRYQDLPNGAGSIIERDRTASDFILNGDHWFNQNAQGVEIEYGAMDMTLDTAFLRVNQDTYTPAAA